MATIGVFDAWPLPTARRRRYPPCGAFLGPPGPPGLVVPVVLFGTLSGAQELCFRFDGEVTICRRYGVFRFSSKSFQAKDIQRLVVSQAPAYAKNGNRINHLTNTSTLDIELPDETLHVMFPNDSDQAIARYCGARLRQVQRTF